MIENETAKLEKPDSRRCSSCRYPSWARSCSSVPDGAAGVTAGSGARALIGGLLALPAPMIRPVELAVNDLNVRRRSAGRPIDRAPAGWCAQQGTHLPGGRWIGIAEHREGLAPGRPGGPFGAEGAVRVPDLHQVRGRGQGGVE